MAYEGSVLEMCGGRELNRGYCCPLRTFSLQ